MPVDPYAPCPCGSGKKLKFCCGVHWPELEKIQELYGARQDLAALDAIARLEAKLPDHPYLLHIKSELLAEQGRRQEADAVRDALIARHPENAHARFYAALRLARDGDLPAAIRAWYAALGGTAKGGFVSTGLTVGRMLSMGALGARAFVAARMLLNVLGSLDPQDETIQELIVTSRGSETQPLLMRELPPLVENPADSRWTDEFTAAAAPARWGDLPKSEALFTALAEKAPREPAVWANLAALRASLADFPAAAQAYVTWAECATDQDEAVEAEALGLLYRDDLTGNIVEEYRGEFEVQDLDRAIDGIAKQRRFARLPDALIERDEEDTPPPKAVFRWLDKPQIAVSAATTFEDVPAVVGEIQLFGRQTDRAARIVVEALSGDRFDEAVAALRAATDEALPALSERQISGSMFMEAAALAWSPQLPVETPADQVYELNRAWHRHAIKNQWTQTKNRYLNGATPAEAAADPARRRQLAATILLLEGDFDQVFARTDFDELRVQLGLPLSADIDPTALPPGMTIQQIPVVRLPRVDAAKLTDALLVFHLQRAAAHHAGAAVWHLGEEALRRPIFDAEARANFNAVLAQLTINTKAAVERLVEGQRCLVQAKQSPAYLMLLELRLRFQRREARDIDRILKALTTKHAREPGVMQNLAAFLEEIGLITPDGRPVAPPADQPGLVLPGEEEAAGKLWTPETASATPGKSALWVPGME